MQSMYDFAIANDWSGETALIDGNTIIAGVIAAGIKERVTVEENGDEVTKEVFSGIIMGDMIEAGMTDAATGLYGVDKGTTTFSLTENG
jgi:hypothetical protein